VKLPLTTAFVYCFLSLPTNAIQLSATGSSGQLSSRLNYNYNLLWGGQTGASCRVNGGSSEGILFSVDYSSIGGGVYDVPCNGNTTWSPVRQDHTYSVPFTLTNAQNNTVSVNLSYGVHNSQNAWTSIGPYIIPARSVCTIDYTPTVSFATTVNNAPDPVRIISSVNGNGFVEIISNTGSFINSAGSNNKISIGIKTNGVDTWNNSTQKWEGTTQGDYFLHVDKPKAGGQYSGQLQVVLSCN
jgi:hypothetical protein